MVIILPEVQHYFRELSYILYEKDYFGFLDASGKYVEELVYDIKTTLPIRFPKAFRQIRKRYVLCEF